MKKILLATAALGMLAALPAEARTSVGVGIDLGGPVYAPAPAYYPPPAPVYYAPPPPVYYPYGYYRHRDYDWAYWNRPYGHNRWVADHWASGVYVRGHWE